MDDERKAILLILAEGQSLKDLIDQLNGWDILNNEYEELDETEKAFVRAGYK